MICGDTLYNVLMQSNSKAVYNFAADFVRKTSQYLEPYIQLVQYLSSSLLSFSISPDSLCM